MNHENIYLYDNNQPTAEKPTFNTLVLGDNKVAAEYQQITVYAHREYDSKLHITDQGASVDLNDIDLIAQSNGFSQLLISGKIEQATGHINDGICRFCCCQR